MNRLLFLLFVLISSSCCKDSVQSGHAKVTDVQKETLSHRIDSSYTFTAPGNQIFEIAYAGERLNTVTFGGEHCGDSYSLLDFYYRDFKSSQPDLFITFGLQADFDQAVNISINKSQFGIVMNLPPDVDTITINGVLYSDVYSPNVFSTDTTTLFYDKIWYDQSHGLLQFTTNNGQVFKRK
jgi:hypothetical protein